MYLCSILWIIVLVFTVISVFTQKNHTVALQRVQERVQENEKNNKKNKPPVCARHWTNFIAKCSAKS